MDPKEPVVLAKQPSVKWTIQGDGLIHICWIAVHVVVLWDGICCKEIVRARERLALSFCRLTQQSNIVSTSDH